MYVIAQKKWEEVSTAVVKQKLFVFLHAFNVIFCL
jgi:hypothetical protein